MKQGASGQVFLLLPINQCLLVFQTWETENESWMISFKSYVLMYVLPYRCHHSVSSSSFNSSSISCLYPIGRAALSPTVLPWRCWHVSVPVRWSRWQWNRQKLTRDWLGWWVMDTCQYEHTVQKTLCCPDLNHVFLNAPPRRTVQSQMRWRPWKVILVRLRFRWVTIQGETWINEWNAHLRLQMLPHRENCYWCSLSPGASFAKKI